MTPPPSKNHSKAAGRSLVIVLASLASTACASTGASQPTVTVTVTQTATATPNAPSKSPSPSSTGLAARPQWDVPSSEELATDLLGRVPVAAAHEAGYRRDAFGQRWSDASSAQGGRNGCDTRNDVLRRDLTAVQLKPGTNGCAVLSGALADPYSGRNVQFLRGVATSSAVQIDHVVSLRDGWRSGGHAWTDQDRVAFANDPLNLITVSGEDNVSKGDRDAAGWLPKNTAYRCEYVARQVAVKARWRLTITPPERATMVKVLHACPGQRASGRPWQVPTRVASR